MTARVLGHLVHLGAATAPASTPAPSLAGPVTGPWAAAHTAAFLVEGFLLLIGKRKAFPLLARFAKIRKIGDGKAPFGLMKKVFVSDSATLKKRLMRPL